MKRTLQPQLVALGLLSVISSFALGVKTAGDVETIAPSQAGGMQMAGDMNSDSMINVLDVIDILEVVQGYEMATPEQLQADPNGDGQLTVDDAIRLLHDIASL